MHKLSVEFSKFTVVGVLNFVFTFVLFYISVKVLSINYLIALMAVSLLGMLFTYSLNYLWVFKPEQKISFKGRLLRYILSGMLSISLNLWLLEYLVVRTKFDPFYVQTALIPLIVIFNFCTSKFWSLRQNM